MKFILLGPQGSGKSTQAKMLANKYGIPHIEMGQLLRDKMQETDHDAKLVREAMEGGTLVPSEITIRTLNSRLSKSDCNRGFVLDGYPRNEEQIQNLPEGIDKVIYVNVPDDEAVARLSKRARADDTPQVLLKRLDIYHQETEPLLTHFRERGSLI